LDGFDNCFNNFTCVPTNTLEDCGTCGTPCTARANELVSCSSQTCTPACVDGYLDCDLDPATGCEFVGAACPPCPTCTSSADCTRRCTQAIGVDTFTCVSGQCVIGNCTTGRANCDANVRNGCEKAWSSCPGPRFESPSAFVAPPVVPSPPPLVYDPLAGFVDIEAASTVPLALSLLFLTLALL
jgi:hypothetical protein